jgi:hypothetical protein
VNLLVHYGQCQLPQKVETIQQELGADSRPGARNVHDVDVKMKNSRKNNRCIVNHSGPQKNRLGKRLGEVWKDLQADPEWKYEQLCPVELLEKSDLRRYPKDHIELVRAAWFWSRRPRWLVAASTILWVSVALGLPFWLFVVPSIGVPLIIVAALIINTELVRSVRWRRQYELSIDRLLRTVDAQKSGGPSKSNP